jgi:hypothetical protein
MPKLHTRQKRKLRMRRVKNKNRKTRPKTFKTEQSAKKYAETKGIKKYKLVDLKSTNPKEHKFKIVE